MHPLVVTLVSATLAIVAARADAATFVVNSTADTTDGVCGTALGGCTLHEAIEAVVATAGRDTIAFDPAVFPIGAPGEIILSQPTPVIADPAGTGLDGAGAGVIIEAITPMGPSADPLVFASAPGVPLAKVTVANVTVREFVGSGIVVCGGEYPSCDEDVSTVLVQNVVASSNGAMGIKIEGRDVSKVTIADSVVSEDEQGGIRFTATGTLASTKISGCTARDNGGSGIDIVAGGLQAMGTVITDSVAVHNSGFGIGITAQITASKTKLTNVAVTRNTDTGLSLLAGAQVTALSIASTAASDNLGTGIAVESGNAVAAVTLKDVVADGNLLGIQLDATHQVSGAKITNVKAAGNQNGGMILTPFLGLVGAKVSRSVVTGNGAFGLRFNGSNNTVNQVRAIGNDGDAAIQLDGPGSGNTIQKCAASTNNALATIIVGAGSTGNVIQKNVSLGNDGADLTDLNPGCDGNTWKQNVFQFPSDACIH